MEDLDRRILAFAGAHRFVLDEQVQELTRLGPGGVKERIDRLEAQRLLRRERLGPREPSFVRITGAGLRAIGSRLPAPGCELREYRHVIGVGWLWALAWQGGFGDPDRVLSEREMRALDRVAQARGEADGRFAVPADGGTAGGGWLYPDLMLVFGSGQAAVQLVSWPHRRLDLDALFAGHRARPEVAKLVLVLADDDEVAKAVRAAAERQEVSDRVSVQRVSGQGTGLPEGRPSAG